MPFQVSYDPQRECVFAHLEGEVDRRTYVIFGEQVVHEATSHSSLRILADLRDARLQMTAFEIYDIPSVLERAGIDRLCRRAILISRDFEDWAFYATASRNRGHLVEIFSDADPADRFRGITAAESWLGIALPDYQPRGPE